MNHTFYKAKQLKHRVFEDMGSYQSLPKKKKVKNVKLTAHKVWPYVSEFIRLRDCLLTTKTIEKGRCYTCTSIVLYKQSQAGHLIDGHTGMNYLDIRGIKLQCVRCNVFCHGLKEVFIPRFIKEYGQELYDELLKEKEAHKWTQEELRQIKENAQRMIKLLRRKI